MAEKKEKVNSKKKSKKNTEEVDVKAKKGKETKKSEKEQEVEVEEQVEVQEQEQTQDFETKYNELNEKYLRLTAEFDNFRRRSLKEKMELIKSAGEDILLNILPVMDNFERAMKSMEGNGEEEKNAVIEGVELIYSNFKDFLSQRGVKEIEAIGKEFDTDHHEAVTKIPAPEEDMKGKVIDVIEKGYVMHEKVIRFAKVVVGE
jgi:molecular chaperone GrpE